ncbi:hypothetical protein L2E82_49258 [Cichorium intybus]|uniref:Uncharacterized protein n=1 Tax=Cichorium intybus TaxID=13427 RepID=A0ACB8Z1E9_CICIN|nr:hypothetical protein L2E82_49258 [Cichorium intybus]
MFAPREGKTFGDKTFLCFPVLVDPTVHIQQPHLLLTCSIPVFSVYGNFSSRERERERERSPARRGQDAPPQVSSSTSDLNFDSIVYKVNGSTHPRIFFLCFRFRYLTGFCRRIDLQWRFGKPWELLRIKRVLE